LKTEGLQAMKMLLMLIVLTGMALGAKAQTVGEWFRQKETQRKYLLEQIAALRLYQASVKKGYALARQKLATIGSNKAGALNQDKEYFNSLKNVRPRIRHQARVADIIALQVKIIEAQKHFSRQVKESGVFHTEEISYVNRVFRRLQEDCNGRLDELILLTTNGSLEMNDSERLERIDTIYQQMQEKYTMTQSFGRGAMVLGMARIQERQDVLTSQFVNGINNQAA
jgi:hypothetical protein